jgi:hypothetical protein
VVQAVYARTSTAAATARYVVGLTGLPDEPARLCALVRCVFGSPFRPVAIDRALLAPTVTSLARAAYEERALPSGELSDVRLSILADALEEAGCTEAAFLEHLRSPGPHVRGCYAVDLALGRG